MMMMIMMNENVIMNTLSWITNIIFVYSSVVYVVMDEGYCVEEQIQDDKLCVGG